MVINKIQIRLLNVLLLMASVTAVSCQENIRNEAGFIKCKTLNIPQDMKCIPGGAFTRGSDRVAVDEDSWREVKDEAPPAQVTLSTFFMDTYEVTYGQYQNCVKAGKCDKKGPNYRNYDHPQQPMVGMNWFDARDYCRYVGKSLPTEAQFEKAARGPDGELYPWGNEPADCDKAIIKYNGKRSCGVGPDHGVTFKVGSRPAFRYGLHDIAGNSWEWTNDWYTEGYDKCGEACLGKDPEGPCNGADECPGHKKRVLKSGSWYWSAEYALGSNRRPHYPINKPFHHFGFRCAKKVDLETDLKKEYK